MKNKWLRRFISISVIILSMGAMLLTFPCVFLLLLLVDMGRDHRFPLLRAYLLLLFYGLWEMVGITGAFLAWLCSGVWAGCNRGVFLDWNYALQRLWVGGFARVGLRLFGMTVRVEAGDYPLGDQPVLLLVRHTSLADTILTTYLMRVQRNFRLRYVMKRELLWDPCLDIVGNRLPNYFVDRASANTHQEVEAIATLADGLNLQEGVILWPESTRFSPAKRDRALAKLQGSGDEELLEIASEMQFVLPPRPGGVLGLLDRNPNVDIFFCAHTGFENASSFKDFFNGALIDREIHAKLWGFPPEAIPKDQNAKKKWIFENWQLVDNFVAKAYASRHNKHLES